MIGKSFHFALRELINQLRGSRAIVVMFGISLILAIADPFGATADFAPILRIVYWFGLVFTSYSAGYLANRTAEQSIGKKIPPRLRDVVAATIASPFVAIVVVIFNTLIEPAWLTMATIWSVFLSAMVISIVISLIISQISSDEQVVERSEPEILQRLDFNNRGHLISLSAEDHYVRVNTIKGSELILIRLADAIALTKPIKGVQTHRSYWIALSQLKSIERNGQQYQAVMTDGNEVPISRSRYAELKRDGVF